MPIGYSSSQQRSIHSQLPRLFLPVAIFLILALALGCRGFFVNPKVTSISATPSTLTLSQGQTRQMTATGNYDDGSTKNLSGSVAWSSSAPACATVSSTGLVVAATSVSNTCSTTITATSGTFTATATITVTPGTLVSITLTAQSTTVPAGSTVLFTAMGTYSGSSQQQNITTQVTWTVSNTTILTINQGSGSGTVSNSATSGSTTTVTASLNGITSNAVTITVQ